MNAESYETAELIKQAQMEGQKGEDAFAVLVRRLERHLLYGAYQVSGRYITKSDEEWSVTLLAFHEAVKKYAPDKGSFLAFADMVVRRRLIDYIRVQSRKQERATDFDHFEERPLHQGVPIEETKSALQQEISELKLGLSEYGITFADLTDVSPKAKKTRRACGKIINLMAEETTLLKQMKKTGNLPGKKIKELSGIPQKIIDRHRKYLIAAIEIATGDYPHLQEFLKEIRKEGCR